MQNTPDGPEWDRESGNAERGDDDDDDDNLSVASSQVRQTVFYFPFGHTLRFLVGF